MAAARLGCQTAILTQNLDTISQMSCNPAIGGLAKGHVVREIDALGGVMGRNTDATGIQFRMLNARKGPSVQAPRAQCDKKAYQFRMKWLIENQPNLTLFQQAVDDLMVEGDRVVDRFQSLMNAGVYINSFIESYTGITNEMISAAPPAHEVMAQAARFVGDAPLVAHNASFDRRFWSAELGRLGLDDGAPGATAGGNPFACTLLLSRRLSKAAAWFVGMVMTAVAMACAIFIGSDAPPVAAAAPLLRAASATKVCGAGSSVSAPRTPPSVRFCSAMSPWALRA